MCSDVSAKEDEKDSFLNRPNGGRYLPIGIMSFAPFLFVWREGVIHLILGKYYININSYFAKNKVVHILIPLGSEL